MKDSRKIAIVVPIIIIMVVAHLLKSTLEYQGGLFLRPSFSSVSSATHLFDQTFYLEA